MGRFNIIVMFFSLVISTSLLFQNCSEMKAETTALSTNNFAEPLETRVIPENLTNQLIPLDNKVFTGPISFSVGGTDVFTYETDYLATYETTLVKIRGENSQVILEVIADNCKLQKNLSDIDVNDFSQLFSESYSRSQQKVLLANEVQTPFCSFPRLVMNASGLNADVDIYFSSNECVPANELFISDATTEEQTLKIDLQAFFKNHIDQMCAQ